jgi:DNA-directed RNA polymerase specialized sigma24 family protein
MRNSRRKRNGENSGDLFIDFGIGFSRRRRHDSHVVREMDSESTPKLDEFCASENLDPDMLYCEAEDQKAVHAAVDSLGESLRVAVWLHNIEERQIAEAARLLNVSTSAVKIGICRARAALRESLEGRIFKVLL